MSFQKISVKNIRIGKRFRKDIGSIQLLENSIATLGLLQPIIVKQETSGAFTLLAGFRRLQACKSLGFEKIDAHVMGDKK
ncbi:ParB N-terminal domain-containing protein [Nitrosopumilus maritimus]|uniref:ParB domain protein nuclease n=1 Tax=Nitrosopumilus maritimus (strain SCM1) TaxID=436308 RepID=A9A5Q7_NITMS|nr:ParB N-terminal domain-containing protein [Nitrosopumilus maritimus]ABX13062.1 ParB domain protein nuclease [Nitrosopumilus maritimus SCM1]